MHHTNHLLRRSFRSKRSVRQRSLRVESLEAREVLSSVTMSGYEQLLIELVNRARANPLAEVDRYSGISALNENLLADTISTVAKQPLAPHQALIVASGAHSDDMLDRDYFGHTNLDGLTPSDRALAAGYPVGAGENLAWGGSTGTLDPIDQVYARHESLFLSPGHRENMLTGNYRELGVGVRYGVFTTSRDWNASMVTEMFSNRGGNPFLTGVAFTDQVSTDDFYTVGEGAENVMITAVDSDTGTTYSKVTGPSGGYSLQLPAGRYSVVATGGGISGEVRTADVVIETDNVKLDIITTEGAQPNEVHEAAIVGFLNGVWWRADSNGTEITTTEWTSWPQSENWHFIQLADVDADGLHEIIGRRDNGEWWVTRKTNDGAYVSEHWANWSTAVEWHDVRVGDVNGDGHDDVLGRTTSGSWWVSISTGTSFTNQRWGVWSRLKNWHDVSVGDFNGDGNDDIAGRLDNGSWWVAASTGEAFENTKWGRWSPNVSWEDVQVGDFNHDGRDDLVGRARGNWWVAESSGTRFTNHAWGVWSTKVDWKDVCIGDFDNDGRDDIVGRANGSWWIARSTGTDFQNEFWGKWSPNIDWQNVQVADFNRDGRDDIIARTSGEWWIAESSGEDFTSRALGTSPTAAFDTVLAGLVS